MAIETAQHLLRCFKGHDSGKKRPDQTNEDTRLLASKLDQWNENLDGLSSIAKNRCERLAKGMQETQSMVREP
jgi:hypothetical protein